MRESKLSIYIFIGIEAILYLTFMIMDLTAFGSNVASNYLKMSSIVLCLFFLIYRITIPKNQRDLNLVRMAFLFTCFADICLLLNNWYVEGIIFFFVVQIIYLHRLLIIDTANKKNPQIKREYTPSVSELFFTLCSLWKNALLSILFIITLLLLKVRIDVMLLCTIAYFTCFVRNIWIILRKCVSKQIKTLKLRLFSIGMILFFACDINVGLFNLTTDLSLSKGIMQLLEITAGVAMWMFYLPAMVCITLSAIITE